MKYAELADVLIAAGWTNEGRIEVDGDTFFTKQTDAGDLFDQYQISVGSDGLDEITGIAVAVLADGEIVAYDLVSESDYSHLPLVEWIDGYLF